MTMKTEAQILKRLKSIQLLQRCDLKIRLKGVGASLEICSNERDRQDLARYILGLARLADSYGLNEVTITGEGFNPLTFPITALEFYGMTNEKLEQIKARARRHQALLDAMPGQIVFLHAQEEPFTFLDARTPIEERLNVPLLELLGSPVNRLESQLAELREFWLRRAIALGTAQSYTYTHHWRNLDWAFKVHVAPIGGTEEAIAIVSDAAPWQLPWWQSQAAAPAQKTA